MLSNANQNDSKEKVGIVIVSASCCLPGMAPFDEQARRVIDQAVSETGIAAEVKMMPATTAMMGGVPKGIMEQLIGLFNQGKIGLPAILINGKPVSFGVPRVEDVKAALVEIAGAKKAEKAK